MRPVHTRARGGREGVTLVEMVAVLAVIGIVTAMALPRIGLSKYRVDSGARTLRGMLQQASRLAVVKQQDIIVGIDTGGMRLRVVEDANFNHRLDVGERFRWYEIGEGVRFAAPPAGVAGGTPGAVRLTAPMVVDGYPTLIFYRDGSASGDAELYLAAASREGTELRAVVVTQSTARCDWYRRLGAVWSAAGI
ncbi:MAG: hypothetical protein NVS4B3_07050 [Gemmatimonadaceae bacterium]